MVDKRTINDALKTTGVIDEIFKVYEAAPFLLAGGAVTHDFRGDTGGTGQAALIINDGIGDLTVEISIDGSVFSDPWRMEGNETLDINDVKIHSIRMTPIADTSYRMMIY